jgi:hypothetical protein
MADVGVIGLGTAGAGSAATRAVSTAVVSQTNLQVVGVHRDGSGISGREGRNHQSSENEEDEVHFDFDRIRQLKVCDVQRSSFVEGVGHREAPSGFQPETSGAVSHQRA